MLNKNIIKYLPAIDLEMGWELGNDVLYKLCQEHPYHKSNQSIVAKVWLIGRSYSAAIERRKNKSKSNDKFYLKDVVNCFKNESLDKQLAYLRNYDNINDSNISEILSTHKFLLNRIKEITDMDKRSFCSKYLHFHLPNLYYLYDSRASKALNVFGLKLQNDIPSKNCYDRTYAVYYYKCNRAKKEIEKYINKSISPRKFDNMLIAISNRVL